MKLLDKEFMSRQELIDFMYEASETNLKQSFVDPINDPLDLIYKNINTYLRSYISEWSEWSEGSICWGGYAFLDYEDKKTISGKNGIFFSKNEKAFIKKMKEASNSYSEDCLTSPYYDSYVFDDTKRAFITPDRTSRVVVDDRFEQNSLDKLDLSKLEPFQLPRYINAVDVNDARKGFYACYDNLDLLSYFEDLCPNDNHVKYHDNENAYRSDRKRAAKKFVEDEIFSKFIKDIGPINTLKFILVHHCHSLGMLLTAKRTSWNIYQNFHVIAYDDKKCMAYGFDTIDD